MNADTPEKPSGKDRDLIAQARAQAKAAANENPTATLPMSELTRTAGPDAQQLATDPMISIPGYEQITPLSRGGQGIVYRAIQTGTQRQVAIKVLIEGAAAAPETRRRFQREIELAATLRHPHIVPLFHSGETEEGRQYYVMDYVAGAPLRRYVSDNTLALEDTLRLFAQVCAAVQYAHQRGIIHRDLKPSNILVDAEGQPKILDFGLARDLTSSPEQALSLTHEIMGTLPYMSPEQTRGQRDEIDTRSDVYALGVILYELLTGHFPYPVIGNVLDVVRHIAETQPTPPVRRWSPDSGVSRQTSRRFRGGGCPITDDLQTVVLRALAKEPLRRYQSAGELAREIERILNGAPIDAKRDSWWYMLRKTARRNLPQTIVAASVLVILVSASAIALDGLRRAAAERGERQKTGNILAREVGDYAKLALGVQPALLGAFLLEWRAGHTQEARWIHSQILPGSPESLAAAFLLDDERDFDQLLAATPAESHAVAYFVLGEQMRLRGDQAAARDAYQHALDSTPEDWYRTVLAARVRHVDAQPE